MPLINAIVRPLVGQTLHLSEGVLGAQVSQI